MSTTQPPGIMQRMYFIRDAVKNLDSSKETTEYLKVLQSDTEFIPVYKVPIGKLATAALSIIGTEEYNGNDPAVFRWRDILLSL
jgi:hypothetical protein